MANALGTETPPSPDPGGGNALSSGAVSGPAQPPAQAAGAPGGQPAPQGPTHAQMVAALRHFDAVRKELGIIAQDPALGKSNVKSKITDGVVRLVAGGIMQTTQAVDELSKVPDEPLLQMKWTKAMLAQAQAAENGILDHYGATAPHFGTVADHFADSADAGDPDDHHGHMKALAGIYGGGNA